jgi:5-methylcytosine-specific restriction endonuclease McrBC GTP-binding regulatory subunit McrB
MLNDYIEDRPLEEVIQENYDDLLTRYRSYKENGQIEFTTFHQSYSYEEFIEGIKPVLSSDDNEQIPQISLTKLTTEYSRYSVIKPDTCYQKEQ